MKKRKEFYKELSELLKKHKATVVASDEGTGYSECGQDIQIWFELEGDYYEQPDLGSKIDGEKLDKMLNFAN